MLPTEPRGWRHSGLLTSVQPEPRQRVLRLPLTSRAGPPSLHSEKQGNIIAAEYGAAERFSLKMTKIDSSLGNNAPTRQRLEFSLNALQQKMMKKTFGINLAIATINSRNVRSVFRALVMAGLGLLFSTTGGILMACQGSGKDESASDSPAQATSAKQVASTLFSQMNKGTEYNASGVVALADSRFLFCDNNIGDALIEFGVSASGQQQGPLVRRPLVGLSPKSVDDIEDLTMVERDGRRLLFAVTSLSVDAGKKGKPSVVRPGGLLRITIGPDGSLATELMSDFRSWLLMNAPEIASAAQKDPDAGGLNVEGLAWDERRGALLLGIRTPVVGGKPLLRPIRVKDLSGSWTTSNLEMLPQIALGVENSTGEQGVRSLIRNKAGDGFFVVVGNSTSASKAPFSVYSWDGADEGKVARLPISFEKKMKPEGITTGTIGGRDAVLFVDDRGGFSILWADAGPFSAAKPQ